MIISLLLDYGFRLYGFRNIVRLFLSLSYCFGSEAPICRTMDQLMKQKQVDFFSIGLDAFTSRRCGFLGSLHMNLYETFLLCQSRSCLIPDLIEKPYSLSNSQYVCVTIKLDLNAYLLDFSQDIDIDLNFLLETVSYLADLSHLLFVSRISNCCG